MSTTRILKKNKKLVYKKLRLKWPIIKEAAKKSVSPKFINNVYSCHKNQKFLLYLKFIEYEYNKCIFISIKSITC